jgi:hypothetical protein
VSHLPRNYIAARRDRRTDFNDGSVPAYRIDATARGPAPFLPVSASGGAENEAWSDYAARFSDYIPVRSLSVEEHFPPLDGIWNMTVYLEDGSGGMTESAISEAKRIIDGIGSDTGGYCAPGINIRYPTPEMKPVNIKRNVTADRDAVNELDESVIVEEPGDIAVSPR